MQFNYDSKDNEEISKIDCWFSTILNSSLNYLTYNEREVSEKIKIQILHIDENNEFHYKFLDENFFNLPLDICFTDFIFPTLEHLEINCKLNFTCEVDEKVTDFLLLNISYNMSSRGGIKFLDFINFGNFLLKNKFGRKVFMEDRPSFKVNFDNSKNKLTISGFQIDICETICDRNSVGFNYINISNKDLEKIRNEIREEFKHVILEK